MYVQRMYECVCVNFLYSQTGWSDLHPKNWTCWPCSQDRDLPKFWKSDNFKFPKIMKMFMIFWLNLRRGLDEAEDVEDLSNWMQLSHAHRQQSLHLPRTRCYSSTTINFSYLSSSGFLVWWRKAILCSTWSCVTKFICSVLATLNTYGLDKITFIHSYWNYSTIIL